MDVLIAGAGPTGLMLGILLEKLGLSFRIIDVQNGPVKESRALGVQARTLELFHKLGIVDKFLERGLKAKGLRLHLKGKKQVSFDFSDIGREDTLFPYVFLISQHETESILSAELKTPIERATTLVDFSEHRDGVQCTVLKDGKEEVIEARYLCGCDGSHSIVRKKLNLEFTGGTYDADFVMADTKINWDLENDCIQVFLESGKIGVYFPMTKDLCRVLAIDESKTGPITQETTQFPATLKEVEQGLKNASHKMLKLYDPSWVTRYRVHHRCVKQMRVGKIFLLGDAAHIHSPIGAQGMNTGLQDANNLAWKLKIGSEEMLESYQRERHPVAVKLLNVTDRAFSVLISKNRFVITVRNLIIPWAAKLTRLSRGRKLLFGFVSQLNIHYGNSLRAPNGKLKDGRNLHELMQGYEFYVLAFKRGEFSLVEQALITENSHGAKVVFLDQKQANDELFTLYGVKDSGTFLVRPDGHLDH